MRDWRGLTLDNVEDGGLLAVLVLECVHRGVALDKDQRSISNSRLASDQSISCIYPKNMVSRANIPLADIQQVLSSRAVGEEACDAEPARLRVIARAVRRGNDVFCDLATVASGGNLWLHTHAADDCHTRKVAARSSTEGTEERSRVGGGSERRAEGVEAEHCDGSTERG